MNDRWNRLEEWLTTNAPELTGPLRPPATPEEIDEAEADTAGYNKST